MRIKHAWAVVSLVGWATAAASSPAISVAGAVPTPALFTQERLEALGSVEEAWTEHGATHRVHGVPLEKILAAAGFSSGPMGKEVPKREKRAGWKMALRVTAVDGYETVFSCAELSSAMGPTRALLVWEVDGKSLGPEAGPFRIVVLTDKEPSRSVHNVSALEVLDLRRETPGSHG